MARVKLYLFKKILIDKHGHSKAKGGGRRPLPAPLASPLPSCGPAGTKETNRLLIPISITYYILDDLSQHLESH